MLKINKIDLRKESIEENFFNDVATLQENGDIMVSSFDFGPTTNSIWGHDYEYNLTLEKEWKDTLLLLLIKENFKNTSEFKKWIDEKNIPSKTFLW